MAMQMQMDQAADNDAFKLPIVGISPFISDPNPSQQINLKEAKQRVVEGMSRLKETGFILLKGHGLDIQFLSSTFKIHRDFFCDLPSDLLDSTAIQSPVPRGYAALNSENFGSLIGDIVPNDLNCKFRIGPEHHNGEQIRIHKNDESLNPYYGTKGARCLLFPNVWPSVDAANVLDQKWKEIIDRFKASMLRAYDSMHLISTVILDIFQEIFVDEMDHRSIDFNAECFKHQTSILSANYYPTKNEMAQKYGVKQIENGQMAIAEHSDIDLFTVIAQSNNCGGVEIKVDNEWIGIPYDENENYLVLNVGDGLQYLTRNQWQSTKHRVRIPEGNIPRQIIAFFAAFNYDARMTPLIERRSLPNGTDDQKEKEEPDQKIVTYFQWRKKRIKKVVQHLRKLKKVQ